MVNKVAESFYGSYLIKWRKIMGKSEESQESNFLETLDDLIFHMNESRMTFSILNVTSLIVAPISIIVALFFLFHPGFIRLLLLNQFFLGVIFLLYVILTVVISTVWLIVGLKEHRFLSKWNNRFRKYLTLKEKIDRELGD